MEDIIKKDIPGYEGRYQATTDGRIWNVKSQTYLNPYINNRGYYRLTLRGRYGVSGERTDWNVHRLIALTFIENPENKPTVDHINRNPLDNRVENLRWATIKEQNHNQNKDFVRREHAVECRDINNHDILIASYPNCVEAAISMFNDKSKNSLINRCAQGKVRVAYGYWWCFSDNK